MGKCPQIIMQKYALHTVSNITKGPLNEMDGIDLNAWTGHLEGLSKTLKIIKLSEQFF